MSLSIDGENPPRVLLVLLFEDSGFGREAFLVEVMTFRSCFFAGMRFDAEGGGCCFAGLGS